MVPENAPPRIPGVRRVVGTAAVGLALVVTALALPSSGPAATATCVGATTHVAPRHSRRARTPTRPAPRPTGLPPTTTATRPPRTRLPGRRDRRGHQDPTTAAERRASAAYVARERRTAGPRADHASRSPRAAPAHPQDRYAMANGCYTATAGGDPIFFKPTDLGDYLLYDARARLRDAPAATSRRARAPRRCGRPGSAAAASRFTQRRRRPAPAAARTAFPLDPHAAAARPTPSRRSTSPATRTPA